MDGSLEAVQFLFRPREGSPSEKSLRVGTAGKEEATSYINTPNRYLKWDTNNSPLCLIRFLKGGMVGICRGVVDCGTIFCMFLS